MKIRSVTSFFAALLFPATAVAVAAAAKSNLGDAEAACGGTGANAIDALGGVDDEEGFAGFSLEHMGVVRSYYMFVPEGIQERDGAVPMVVDLHGAGACPVLQVHLSGWLALAKKNRFVAVWPLGVTDPDVSLLSCWGLPGGHAVYIAYEGVDLRSTDCCCSLDDEDADSNMADYDALRDDEFIVGVIDAVQNNVRTMTEGRVSSIDRNKTFVVGHANGGVAALALAALHSDKISGVAVHAGKLVTKFPAEYTPIPIWMIHGRKDGTFRYGLRYQAGFVYDSQIDMFHHMSDRNGCSSDIVESSLLDEEEGQAGTVQTRTNCTNGADVTLVTLENGGHSPYRGAALRPGDREGAQITTVDTTHMACGFLLGDDSCASGNTSGGAVVAAPIALWRSSLICILALPFLCSIS